MSRPAIEPPISFPVPSVSRNGSESSSENKRRRLNSPSSYRSHCEFSSPLKHKIRSIYKRCWYCEASPVQACHVIGKADSKFEDLRREGLITFDTLNNEQNAIGLCPLCHVNFDDLLNPGLVILPRDLQFFIDFEEENYQHRLKVRRNTGKTHTRECPTALDYEQHQRDNGTLTGGIEQGGLYDRYVLKDFLPAFCRPNSFRPGKLEFAGPKQWHGAPMAAIRRAFMALGSCGTAWVSSQVKQQLRHLQDLYERDLTEIIAEQTSEPRQDPRSPTQSDHHETSSPSNSQPEQRPPQPGEQTHSAPGFGTDPPKRQAPGCITRTTESCPILGSRSIRRGSRCDSAIDVCSCLSTQKYAGKKFHLSQQGVDTASASEDIERESACRVGKRKHGHSSQGWIIWGPTSTSADKITHEQKRRRLWTRQGYDDAVVENFIV